jgi:Tn3 transposase DDE domain
VVDAVILRYRVDRFTPNCAAIFCTGTSFERSSVRMVFSSFGLSFFGRPPLRPRARAALRPASVRSRIRLHSNSANRREDHEISMLALHLIQNCMVYVNTLMIQKVLALPHWQGKFTPRDYAALTPLIWEHVNPYGRFDLDMNTAWL